MFPATLLLAAFTVVSDTQPVVRLAGASRPVPESPPAVAALVPSALPARSERVARAVAVARAKGLVADSILVDKSARKLTLFFRGERVKTYDIALGRNPVGDKSARGDGRTPEGLYFIEGRNPQSKYYLSLRVSYPSAAQRARAARRGVSAGGDIMIHGLPDAFADVGALHRQQDWTEGCVAVTNEEIEEIWGAVPNGAKILILP